MDRTCAIGRSPGGHQGVTRGSPGGHTVIAPAQVCTGAGVNGTGAGVRGTGAGVSGTGAGVSGTGA
eukprot:1106059-Prorocentrum_minimum.AAC.1